MSIVCGTDFSENALQAGRAAAALAMKLGQPLELVHVVDAHLAAQLYAGAQPPVLPEVSERLHQDADELRKLGAEVHELLLTGMPDEELVRHAEKTSATLVIVSSLGRRSGNWWRLGSTADRVAQTSTAPVLVVRDAAPFEAWARGERPLKVILAVDLSETAEVAAAWMGKLRQLGPCDVIVAHVYWPPAEHARIGLLTMDLVEHQPEVENLIVRDLQTRLHGLAGAGDIRFRVLLSFGRPADHLVRIAEEEKADLVIVGAHQRKGLSRLWHGSVSHGVVHLAPMAVACIPAAAVPVERSGTPIPELRTVLVTTDLSALGNHALAYAYAMLAPGGTCHLLHVVDTAMPAGSGMWADEEADRAGALRKLVPAQATERRIETQVHILRSQDVALTICRTAERIGADVVCLSSHGRSGISKLFAGSVAQEVLHRSHRPVLVVQAPREE